MFCIVVAPKICVNESNSKKNETTKNQIEICLMTMQWMLFIKCTRNGRKKSQFASFVIYVTTRVYRP